MRLSLRKAMPVIALALAEVIAPPAPVTPSVWAADNLVVPDGPRAGGRWDPKLTPYIGPIMDALGPDATANMVAVRKSAQTGVSVAAIGLCGAYIDRAPCRIGYAVPTIDALHEFNKEKLSLTIAQTPALKRKVRPQSSRTADGSTVNNKRYPGGSLSLINANSAADLRSRTLKLGIADEIDLWTDDLGDEGDPFDLFKGRFIAFHASGDWRLLAISTPKLLGSSRIDNLFLAGDQRFWHVRCPGCAENIVLQFKHLKFNRVPPYAAHYVAQCCGTVIEPGQKAGLVRDGEFIATNSAGLYPSFHVDALVSLLTTWDEIAQTWWSAYGEEQKQKVFFNTWLGLPYEVRGDAPDHARLLERRADYAPGVVPPEGLLLVAGADVQHSGIWYEVVAYGEQKQSWSIRHGFLEGDTTDPERGAFAELTKLYDEHFADAFGGRRLIEALAVDAGDGGRANQVYIWTRKRERAFAIKGQPGWQTPAIGTPAKVSITLGGKKIASGALLWPVGNYSLKATYYDNLRKVGIAGGAEVDPPGYCYHHAGCDERYFKQQTAESVKKKVVRGRTVHVWIEHGPNHLLDCRVYAMAMADYLGLHRMLPENWIALRRKYGVTPQQAQPDLLAPETVQITAHTPLLASRGKPRSRRVRSQGIA